MMSNPSLERAHERTAAGVAFMVCVLCTFGCGQSETLVGSWSDRGVDEITGMTLQGTSNDIQGSGNTQGSGGSGTFTVSGSQSQLTLTSSGGATTYSVFFLNPGSIFLEYHWQVPVSGTCTQMTFHPEQCIANCEDPNSGGGTPGGMCFDRAQ
jgi:hypothetical protein